jgi:hypothetical protein
MSKPAIFRTDLLIALIAMVIGVATMFVYIYQAHLMSKQMHAAAWPYLEVNFSSNDKSFLINVQNKGAGPAIVKTAYITSDNLRFPEDQRKVDSLINAITGKKRVLTGYTNIRSRVLSPGDVITFAEFKDSTTAALILPALAKHNVRLTICYCSVFDECWTLEAGKSVEPCDKCD